MIIVVVYLAGTHPLEPLLQVLAGLANYRPVTGQLGGGGDDKNDNEKRSIADLDAIKTGLVETLPHARRHLSEAAAILAPSAKFRRVLQEAA